MLFVGICTFTACGSDDDNPKENNNNTNNNSGGSNNSGTSGGNSISSQDLSTYCYGGISALSSYTMNTGSSYVDGYYHYYCLVTFGTRSKEILGKRTGAESIGIDQIGIEIEFDGEVTDVNPFEYTKNGHDTTPVMRLSPSKYDIWSAFCDDNAWDYACSFYVRSTKRTITAKYCFYYHDWRTGKEVRPDGVQTKTYTTPY